VTSNRIARDYLEQARLRRMVLGPLQAAGGRGDLNRLAQERGPAFYGDEAADIPPSELFGEADARRAMAVADRLLDLYTRLLGEQR
jgi:hypothetical protein